MTIKKATIVRTVVLILALVNTILTACGLNPLPFSDEELYEGVSAAVTVGVSLWAWWKNNSFTQPALIADEYMNKLKGEDNDA